MTSRYEGNGFTIEQYVDDSVLFTISYEGEIIKQYRVEDEEDAVNLWGRFCEMVDYFPENLPYFRLSSLGRNALVGVEVIQE